MVIKKDNKKKFLVKRKKEYGGDLSYAYYEKLEKDFISKKLHPLDLKNAVADEITDLLKPIHNKRTELEKLAKKAYS